MTREEAIYELERMKTWSKELSDDEIEAIVIALKALEQEPCEDAISRQAVLDLIEHYNSDGLGSVFYGYEQGVKFAGAVNKLPSVTLQPKTGRWKRMSDLPNDVDDRFECSRCGNVVHHRNVMDLRTFNRWCGRCGSDNG